MNSTTTTTSTMTDLRVDTQAASPIQHAIDDPRIATLEHKEKWSGPHEPVLEALNIVSTRDAEEKVQGSRATA